MTKIDRVPFDPDGPLMDIRTRVFVEEQAVPPELERDEHDETAVHLLATLDGRPVGTARVRIVEGDTAKIERVAVLRECRGTGIGRALMSVLEAEGRRMGARKAKLGAQTHAIPFYEKVGYEAYGPEFDDAGIPHRWMEKALREPG